MRGAIIDIGPAVFNLLDEAGHASPVARMSLCGVVVLRQILQEAIHAVVGYTLRSDFVKGTGGQFLRDCQIPTEPARAMLLKFVDHIDDIILRSLGERPYHRFFYVELGQGQHIYHITIIRLGDDALHNENYD